MRLLLALVLRAGGGGKQASKGVFGLQRGPKGCLKRLALRVPTWFLSGQCMSHSSRVRYSSTLQLKGDT